MRERSSAQTRVKRDKGDETPPTEPVGRHSPGGAKHHRHETGLLRPIFIRSMRLRRSAVCASTPGELANVAALLVGSEVGFVTRSDSLMDGVITVGYLVLATGFSADGASSLGSGHCAVPTRNDRFGLRIQPVDNHTCVFRTNVTGRFGIVTGDFGNVTGHSGNVTERTGRQDWRCA